MKHPLPQPAIDWIAASPTTRRITISSPAYIDGLLISVADYPYLSQSTYSFTAQVPSRDRRASIDRLILKSIASLSNPHEPGCSVYDLSKPLPPTLKTAPISKT